LKFKDTILFAIFWSLFCVSFIAFSLIIILTIFITLPAFLVGACLCSIVIGAFLFCFLAVQSLIQGKIKPHTKITREIYYKPIKLPEPPTPPKKRRRK